MKINLKEQIMDSVDSLEGGMSDDKSLADIANLHGAPLELIELMMKWGIDVEMEHTKCPKLAKEIAMDHLVEDPIYYKKLKDMDANL